MNSSSGYTYAFFLILFVSGMISFPVAAAGDQLKDTGQRWAVIVGISDYQNLGDLDNAVNDALDMKSVLINNCNFAPDHVYTYTNGQASKWSIQNALSLMSVRAGPSDTVVFYFSGHGDQMDRDLSPYDEADGMDEVLCPYDSYSDSYDRDISDDELQTMLGRINSKNTICIFDTCNSGGMVKGSRISAIYGASKDSPAFEAFIRNDGISADFSKDARSGRYVMLMASDDDESAVDSSRLENGVFTYYLVEGLTSTSANLDSDRYISIEEAFSYAQAASTRYDSRMHPQIYDGDQYNEIEFASLSAMPTPTITQTTGGTDITGKTVQGYISSGQSQYYYFDIPYGASVTSSTVTLSGPSGADFDLYIRKGSAPTKDDYDYRGFTSTANEQVSISSPSSGRYYVMVQAYSGSGSYSITEAHAGSTTPTPTPTITRTTLPTTNPTPTVTQSTIATDISGKTVTEYISSGQSKYYYFDISPMQSGRACTITLDGPSGADFDLYVKKGSNPTTDSYDYRGYTSSADEQVSISSPTSGRYYVMVNAYSGSGSFTLTETTGGSSTMTVTPTPTITRTTLPTTNPTPTVTPGTVATDISGRTVTGYILSGQSKYYYFDISPLQSGRTCSITLDGPPGADFDLYVKKGSNPTTDSYDYRGYTASADEQVSISSPTSGRYYVMVNAYSGSGSYTISATAGGSSTLTVTPTPTVTRTVQPTTTPSPTVTQGTGSTDITGRTVQGYISSGQVYYYFDIPSGSTVSSCTVFLDGPAGADYDLFVKRGSNPGTWIFDYRSAGQTADESITISNPSAGRYYVMVKYYSGPGSYTIRETHSAGATVTPTHSVIVTTVPTTRMPTATPSPTITQTSGGTDITGRTVQGYISSGQVYYYFDIPSGSTVSSCTVVLDGPAGADYDLFVKRGSNPGTWIFDYRSAGRTADESITISNPSAGRYYVMVKYYSGPGSYTLRETHSGIVSQTAVPAVTSTWVVPTTMPITVSPTFTSAPADGTGYGSIVVTSSPTSAWVYLDGIPARKITPSTLTVTAGTHTVGCRKTGYPEQVRTVTVVSGMTADVHFIL